MNSIKNTNIEIRNPKFTRRGGQESEIQMFK